MAIVTNQVISNFYSKFCTIDVTFNKDVSKITGLQPKKVFLKLKEGARSCILYSSSMESARVIANISEAFLQELKDSETNIPLRLSFLRDESPKPVEHNFFIQTRLHSFTKFSKDKSELFLLSLNFSTKPPDDLIEILGFLLEANINATKRKEERILITSESLNALHLGSKNCVLTIDNIPRKGILRDLSFSGCKVIIQGNAKFLLNKDVYVKIITDKPEQITIKGKILRFEEVQGRRDLVAVAIFFTLEDLPLGYKMIINNYLFSK